MSLFIRTSFNRVHVLELMCLGCGRTVAASSDLEAVNRAEAAHICESKRLPSVAGGKLTLPTASSDLSAFQRA